jgi:50S ribosomal protein L16 3-hydroxylase
VPAPLDEVPQKDEILQRLAAGDSLERYPGSRFAWSADESGCFLFVDGNAWELPPSACGACRALADGTRLDGRTLSGEPADLAALLCDLLANGSLVWTDQPPGSGG